MDLLHAAGVDVSPVHVKLVLPFGISFFTFETMSYTIDVYRREIEPAKRYLDYLLFVCFFPHLVAGPIVRPHYMLPQFEGEPRFDTKQQAEGLWLIATGLLKKVVIGDTLSVTLVKRAFDNPERFSSIEMLVAVYAYAIKIYMDFSGYTDVARGSAKLFGLELPQNFDAPYTAGNLQEFWHRWHISLSTWLRDYLYKPARWVPRRLAPDLPEPDDHDGARRPLARRQVDLRHLGAPPRARRWPGRASGSGARLASGRFAGQTPAGHVCSRAS